MPTIRFHHLPLLLLMLCIGLLLPITATAMNSGNGGEIPMYQDSGNQSSGLRALFGGGDDELLPPDQAFPFSAELIGDDIIIARWRTADGYYLYRDRLDFAVDGAEIAGYEMPDGIKKDDPNFGLMEVYYGTLEVYLQLDGPVEGDRVVLNVDYQGCADNGVCYPPMQSSFDMAAGSQSAGVAAGGGPSGGADGGFGGLPGSNLQSLLGGGNLPLILGGFFMAGLLLAFTACMYPLIPILSGIIAGDAKRSSGRAFLLSLVFIQATAITYALAGAAAGMTGSAIQADLQGPWVLGVFAALFVMLALAMFGVFNLQMPAAIQNRLDALSRRQRGGTFIGAGIMGVLSALIVGACSGPALIAALAFISNTGDAMIGGLALFAMGNGMGLPLLLIGTAAGRWLPRSGAWMVTVRRVFGVIFIGVAIWMLGRLLPDQAALALWAMLFFGVAGWLLGAVFRRQVGGGAGITRGLAGTAAGVWGAVLITGAAIGGHSFWTPLAVDDREPLPWRMVESVEELNQVIETANADDRAVMVDVYADWCVYCVQLERNTFPDQAVRDSLDDTKLVKVDVTGMNSAHRELLEHLNVFLPPAVIFYGKDGEERGNSRVVGFMPPEDFVQVVESARE